MSYVVNQFTGRLDYVGIPRVVQTRAPGTSDSNYPVPTIWIDDSSSVAYILVSITNGSSTWDQIGAGSGSINTLGGDTGTAAPAGGNINIIGGAGITTSASGSSITITSTSSASWTNVTGTSASMSANGGYIVNNTSLVTLTLPTTAAVGTELEVTGQGTGGWEIAQSAGQKIHFGDIDTTTGAGGFLASTNHRDGVRLVCVVANLEWNVVSAQGNITIF